MSQVDYEQKVWDEVLATKIFYLIFSGEVTYASGIAKKVEKNPQTAKNYINGLKARDLVSEKERIRGKIVYEASTEALAEDYYEVIKGQLRVKSQDHSYADNDETAKKFVDLFNRLSDERVRIESITLIQDYIEELMSNLAYEDINFSLNEILKFEFSFSLNRLYYHRQEYFENNEWLEDFYRAIIYSQLNGWSINILDEVISKRED